MVHSSEDIEKLAAAIGEEVYIDIAKWHLYLSYAHLHTPLAEQLAPMLDDKIDIEAVNKILNSMMVKIGGGKKELSLSDLLPSQAASKLVSILESFK
jgi:hypothetical protein